MKKVVILFDLPESPPENQDYRHYEKDSSWEHELDVKRAIQRLGHEAEFIGIFDDLPRFIREIQESKPDLVFNLCESFRNDRRFEPQVIGTLELLGIPFTGVSSASLSLCQNKELTKKILNFHRIKVPRWVTSSISRPIRSLRKFVYPAFVKPIGEEGSEGISRDSFVENEKDCLDRVHFLHEKFQTDVLIEEFIDGRELYASVMGVRRLQVFPLRELTFNKMPEDEPRFATYRTKWDEAYRKRWGIQNEYAKEIEPGAEKRIISTVKKAFQVLQLEGFARFDLRLTDSGDIYVIEANPNPSISSTDDFALSAKKAGLSYDELIAKILDMGWNRRD